MGFTLTLVFLVLDYAIDREMYARLDHFLDVRASALASQLQVRTPEQAAKLLPEYDLSGHTDFFTMYDTHKRPILRSVNSRGQALRLPEGPLGRLRHYDLFLPDGHPGRAIVLRVPRAEAATSDWLVVATERGDWDLAERRIHLALMLIIAAAVAVAVVLCLLLVRRAFLPLIEQSERLRTLQPGQPPPPPASALPHELAPFIRTLHQALQRLYTAAERERRFSRDMAHELRTPLAEIRASAENAFHSNDASATTEALEVALSATGRMGRGIATLLAMARYESGQMRPALDPLDLVPLLRQQVQALRRIPGAGERLHLAANLPGQAWVHSDTGMLERIFANVLQNAAEYSPEASIAEAGIETADGQYWVWVRNEAPGLQVEDLEYLGARYWRKTAQGATAQHTGLGLALARAIAGALEVRLDFNLENGNLTGRLGPFPIL
ncbi:hypothetical protein ARC78_01230 [Stenotrophomonas pictorum JCM 9942]|uniref:histidine kinase n=4 Tax=Stenotrophomonas pictorum TaxID=86184 RepID=A0A0R0AIU9_9GAMM|nr:hypothetical protein ARC78_01230 [Stenotrophomonas pictorum JCM 9942]